MCIADHVAVHYDYSITTIGTCTSTYHSLTCHSYEMLHIHACVILDTIVTDLPHSYNGMCTVDHVQCWCAVVHYEKYVIGTNTCTGMEHSLS